MSHTARNLYWVGGSGTKVYETPAYWSTARNGTGGNGVGTPDVGDTGIPQAGDTPNILDGAPQFTGSDQSGVSLGGFICDFTPTTTPGTPPLTIGASGAPLKIALAAGAKAKFTGSYGDLYLGITFADATAMALFLASGNVFLSGTASSGAGKIVAGAGKVNIGADYTGSFAVRGLGGSVEIAYAASGTPTVVMDDGNLLSLRTLGTSVLGGGSMILRGIAAISSITCMPQTVYFHDSSGTVALIDKRKGATCIAGNAPFSVTNAETVGDSIVFGSATGVTYVNPPNVVPEGT